MEHCTCDECNPMVVEQCDTCGHKQRVATHEKFYTCQECHGYQKARACEELRYAEEVRQRSVYVAKCPDCGAEFDCEAADLTH